MNTSLDCAKDWRIDYNATDEQLRAFGLEQRIIDLSRRPLHRVGAIDMDTAYLNSVNEAKDRVALAALVINNPDVRCIWYPPHVPQSQALMGYVRHE